MNTKTDGISSGLVAVAWSILNGVHTPLVRLSDAEAIINDLQTLVIAENQRKQQLEQEVAQMKSDLDEEAHIRDRMAQLLAETAVALKGPEKALHRHGWQDLPDVAAKQSAALKLAREALEFYADESRYRGPNQLLEGRDVWSELCGLKAYRLDVTRDAGVIANKAIAAIDALGEAI